MADKCSSFYVILCCILNINNWPCYIALQPELYFFSNNTYYQIFCYVFACYYIFDIGSSIISSDNTMASIIIIPDHIPSSWHLCYNFSIWQNAVHWVDTNNNFVSCCFFTDRNTSFCRFRIRAQNACAAKNSSIYQYAFSSFWNYFFRRYNFILFAIRKVFDWLT